MHLAGPSTGLEGSLWTMQEELDPALLQGIEAHQVIHRRVRARGASYPLYLWSAVSAYRRMRDMGFRPDVMHAHVYGAGVPAALVARRGRIPLVLTEHFSGVAERSLGRIEARKALFAYNSAARILPVSHFMGEAIRSYGVERPLEVVPNVVDRSVFFPAPGKTEPGAERRLLFVGNLEPSHVKGFPMLLRALGRLRERRYDWRLDVIGDGTERLSHERSTAELGLGEHVTFHGFRPKTFVAQAMREADVLVVASRVETFGAVVAEALVTGLPVVATRVGGIPELVDERSGRLVPPDDPLALADALDSTLEGIDFFDSETIAASARDRFSLEVVGQQLDRIYASVLARSSAT